MKIPRWIRKQVAENETIECIATGKWTVIKNGGNASAKNAAWVGTLLGVRFLNKSFLSKSLSFFGPWDKLSESAHIYTSGGIFKTEIIIEIDSSKMILSTSANEANTFLTYISSKRLDISRISKLNKVDSSVDIVDSIKGLRELFDQGIISETEFNQKKNELLNQL